MMVRVLLGVILALSGLCALSLFVSRGRRKRAEAAEAETARLQRASWEARERVKRLQAALRHNRVVEEGANERRKDLADADDADLADHANSLFGVRNSDQTT